MSRIQCFLIEPTNTERRALRRYRSSMEACTVGEHGYHQAMVPIEDGPVVRDTEGYYCAVDWPRDDPRWPKACPCGMVFADEDHWQLFSSLIYRRVDTGHLMILREAPPGAIWDAWWYRGQQAPFLCDERRTHQDQVNAAGATVGARKCCGPDGLSLMVKLPNGGEWFMDGPSRNGEGWTRQGVPPLLTVRPSILASQGQPMEYHGFLTNGYLEAC